MTINVLDQGLDNEICIDPAVLEDGKGTISIKGNGNRVEIGRGCLALQINLQFFGDKCSFHAAPNVRLAAVDAFLRQDGHIHIGENTTFTWYTKISLHEPGTIRFGRDCMIASSTFLTVSDMHSIIEAETGHRVNPAADVALEDHVWLSEHVRVLKGARIGRGSIIGLGSIVTGNVPEQSLFAGVPAKLIRNGVTWRRDLI